MDRQSATAIAHPNIAFIKYWGNRNSDLNIPSNSSISMNLSGLEARTTVRFDESLQQDRFSLNQQPADEPGFQRVVQVLDHIRYLADINICAEVKSEINFPAGTGIASSAAGFAALSLAAAKAAGLSLTEAELSMTARLGSGSASRSVPAGYVEWHAGENHFDSYAQSIASPDHWDLCDVIVVLQTQHKKVGSKAGHRIADSSPLQYARVADAARRLELCRYAIKLRDFTSFAEVVEQDSNIMHAVMISSKPPLLYWNPETLTIMKAVTAWRADGLAVAYTLDAGPNVHLICEKAALQDVIAEVQKILPDPQLFQCSPGGAARIVGNE